MEFWKDQRNFLMKDYVIQEIHEELKVELLNELLTESVSEGFRHITRLVEEYKSGANRFNQEGEALFLCLIGHRVIGICGLNRDPYNGIEVGRLRRLYVLKEFRRCSIGRKLTEAVIHKSQTNFTRLVLKTDNPQASRFYSALDFIEVHSDKNITHYLEIK